MGLVLPQEIEVNVSRNITRYEKLGYKIPREVDNQGRLRVPQDTKIKVSVLDLSPSSNQYVECECDICHARTMIPYSKYSINIKRNNGEYHCKNKVLHEKFLRDEKWKLATEQIQNFIDENGRLPLCTEMRAKNNLPSYDYLREVALERGTTINDFLSTLNPLNARRVSDKLYTKYVEIYKQYMSANNNHFGMYYSWGKAKEDGVNIPKPEWMFAHIPDGSIVHNCDEWESWANIKNRRKELTKERVSEIILDMADTINRPLRYDDFSNIKYGEVSISTINKYWGSLNKMKEALNLPIIREDMRKRIISIEELDILVSTMLNNIVRKEHRNVITCEEFDMDETLPVSGTIRKMVKENYDISLAEYVGRFGFSLVRPGSGLVYTYDNGETVYSRYELIFSNYLRSSGFSFGNNYYRDVRYSDICSDYCGLMNCDYLILCNERKIYIEIAGIIGNYKQWFLSHKMIDSSQSKMRYQTKLYEKQQLLESAGVEFFILFPCDMSFDLFNAIIFGDYVDAKEKLNHHIKNNIDWSKINIKDGITYDWNKVGRDGMPSIVYNQ